MSFLRSCYLWRVGRKDERLAVIGGATGYLGGHVVRAAKTAGYRVRALARNEEGLGDVRDLCDEVFVGRATDPGSLAGLYEGADVGFSSIGIRSTKRKPTIWDVDEGANLNLVAEAERAGVRRYVFVSLFGAPQHRRTVPVAEARERVVDRLRASSMSWAAVRPSGFFNDMRDFLEMAKGGRVWLIGDGATRFNPIHGADLAAACVECFEGQSNLERDVGGPDVFTLREIGALAFDVTGKPPRFASVPPWLVRSMGKVAYPFNNNVGAFLAMFAMLGEGDVVAPSHGSHHLGDFLREELTG